MSNAAVWLGPLIVSLVLAAIIGWGVLAGLFALLRSMAADRAASLAAAERARIPGKVLRQQAQAIDAVIAAINASPATFNAMLPADVRDMLYAAHDKARELERGVK